MSRLDAIAVELGITRDRAKSYTKAIRAQFDSAPSYAQILRAVRDHRGGTPSPQQVVAALKKWQSAKQGGAGKGRRGRPAAKKGAAPRKGRPGASAGKRGAGRAPKTNRPKSTRQRDG